MKMLREIGRIIRDEWRWFLLLTALWAAALAAGVYLP